jgi:mono/diheme cytochrome c family protein
MIKSAVTLTFGVFIILLALNACGSKGDAETTAAPPADTAGMDVALALAEEPEAPEEESSEGEKLVEERCATCHGLDRVEEESASAEEWAEIVDDMIERGAKLTEEERDVVVAYLTEKYAQ